MVASLSACGQGAQEPVQAQRIALDQAATVPAEPLASPDTRGAVWRLSGDGATIAFARPGGPPLLTLECRLRDDPVEVAIVRHAPARPGQKALFPVIGNGMVSRFKVDAGLTEGEWAWEAELPASDPQLDVFMSPLELEATLPGGGTLKIAGSLVPGEFVAWCRAGGKVKRAEAKEAAEVSSAPPGR